MPRKILIIDGHPDGRGQRFVHALASAYAEGAREGGHEVRFLNVGQLTVPVLRTHEDFRSGKPPAAVRGWQDAVRWADHLVVIYPLWLGDMPGLLKCFFEQVMRPSFAFGEAKGRGLPPKLLKGRSARIVVTMGMPGFFYRWYYRAHSLKSLERNILRFAGFAPVRSSVIGHVETGDPARRQAWLDRLTSLGRQGR